jgi:uncharacterized membrane protein
MMKKGRWDMFGKILMILGFVIIIFNAVIYLFNLWFSWSWLSIIGLVFVVVGLKILRISKDKKMRERKK